MAQLPLRNLVLYKNGIGYFVREGELEGDTLKLSFQQDEINDVLKSLSVFDEAGGQVMGIHYETPVNPQIKLANNSIRLSDADSLKTLLWDLRGKQIKAVFSTDAGKTESVTGQIIGIDIEDKLTRFSILREDKGIRILKLDDLREFTILDAQSESDLVDFLETNQSQTELRTINVQLNEGKHELIVSYVAPSPNWRVSYRMIAETDENSADGKAVLLGWGLFDNHIEDLDNVHVTLVAGNPISFQYDLYSSNIPERERVKEQPKLGQGPVNYEPALERKRLTNKKEQLTDNRLEKQSQRYVGREIDVLEERRSPTMRFQSSVLSSTLGRAGRIFGRKKRKDSVKMMREEQSFRTARQAAPAKEVSESVATITEGKDSGEVFQYIVTQPVSVKRGVSALVPIINQPEIDCQRELLFNERKLKYHPVAAFRMKNTTGFTLERGPVTVVENGDYKGEAVIPFTRDGAEVYLPYAVEEGVKIHVISKSSSEEGGQFIRDVSLLRELYYLVDTKYVIENNTKHDKTIRIEATKRDDYDLFESPDPEEETAEFRRWSVTVKANSSSEFKIRERYLSERLELVGGGCNPFARLAIWLMRRFNSLPVRAKATR